MRSQNPIFSTCLLAGLLLLSSTLLTACGPKDGSSRKGPDQEDLQTVYQQKADRYLIKDDTLRNWFAILPEGIALYASPEDKEKGYVECLLYYDEIEAFSQMVYGWPADSTLKLYQSKGKERWSHTVTENLPPLPQPFHPGADPAKPLTGLRVALDPGHMGGTMEQAIREEKAVRMHANDSAGIPEAIAFNEGNLVMATARLLRDQLEAAGAEVMLTRDQPGVSAFGLSYESWLASKYEADLAAWAEERELTEDDLAWFAKANDDQIFHALFKHLDLRERARKINAYRPHIALIIHYNVLESNRPDEEKYVLPIDENYNMAFIPGGYMAGELGKPDRRMEFLAQLVTEDIENSLELSDAVVQFFVKETKVPALDEPHGLRYLEKASMATQAEGVWARNLAINRMTRGTLCFGETLYQDNIGEAQKLNLKDLDVDGLKVSSRVQDIADAYFKGVCDYYGVAVK